MLDVKLFRNTGKCDSCHTLIGIECSNCHTYLFENERFCPLCGHQPIQMEPAADRQKNIFTQTEMGLLKADLKRTSAPQKVKKQILEQDDIDEIFG